MSMAIAHGADATPERHDDFEMIADSISQIIWTATPDGSIDYLNQCGKEYAGLPREANYGRGWEPLLHPEDVEGAAPAWRDAVSCGASLATEFRLRRYDGEFRWHACSARPIQNGDGEIVRWVGTLIDVEDRRAAERGTAETLSLLETLQSTAPVGFGFVDRDFRLVRLNEALAAINGIPIEQQIGRTVAEVIPELWPELGPVYEGVLETGEATVNLEATGDLPGDPGRAHTWLTSLYPVRLEAAVIGIGIVTVDITDRKEMETKLEHLSELDPLTGIYNRRQLFKELDRVLRYAARYGHAGAVLVLDVDNFKWTNDSYGHAAADHLLISVASALTIRLRETDTVARIGGDEFAIILPEATEENARTVALELRALLSERPTGPPVHVSIGIALFDGTQQLTADDVLVAADIAMYQVKEAGGDQASVYDGRSGALMSRVKSIREALTERRFVLHAQPIVDLRNDRIACHELLIRMLSKTGEIIPPGEFLPIAERFSLAGEIDSWVVAQALDLARHQPVTVNLSGRSIGDPRILSAITDAVGAGLDPCNLLVEITETAALNNHESATAFVQALAKLGLDLALDDFGTGFGSFTYLKLVPARYLKIDMEFVRDINNDPTDKEIVRSIVGIARTLGKETIAEGVESPGVLQTLRELGVGYAQGFHLGRPEPLVPSPAAVTLGAKSSRPAPGLHQRGPRQTAQTASRCRERPKLNRINN
jgi:diguanylate cyclase (GGDEF)-like protein/PAS domain S-box-containing protein